MREKNWGQHRARETTPPENELPALLLNMGADRQLNYYWSLILVLSYSFQMLFQMLGGGFGFVGFF